MKVLVIDDQDDLRGLLRQTLEIDDHEVEEAANGVQALEKIQDNRPDLIISDVHMPEMGGIELFETLRAGGTSLNLISFIFISGDTSEEEMIERINHGAVHFIEKPVSLRLLRAHARSIEQRLHTFNQFAFEKLESINEFLPRSINRDIEREHSLVENIDEYVAEISAILQASAPPETELSGPASSDPEDRRRFYLSIIQFFIEEINVRNRMLERHFKSALTWQIIFLVAEAFLSQKELYVSDLYVSANGAKTTINNHINELLQDNILTKRSVAEDGRRQKIALSDAFATRFFSHIDEFSQLATATFGGQRRSVRGPR